LFIIEYYQLPNGRKPAKDFIDSLEVKMKRKALDSLCILEELGNTIREPYSKHIGHGIFELRIQFSNDISRLFYFFFDGNRIIVTNGFIKKSNKTPTKEIKLAKSYKQDYERRHFNE